MLGSEHFVYIFDHKLVLEGLGPVKRSFVVGKGLFEFFIHVLDGLGFELFFERRGQVFLSF